MDTIVEYTLDKKQAEKSSCEKIADLRNQMHIHGINVWIIPSFDPHSCEYPPQRWHGRAWISGFTGTAGTLLVTHDNALLWTDGRYHLQAANELQDSGISVMRQGLPGVLEIPQWLAKNLDAGKTIGFDGCSMPYSEFESIKDLLEYKNVFFKTEQDLLDLLWHKRPLAPSSQVFEHELKFAGKSIAQKLFEVRSMMSAENANSFLISSLDDIAWLFNIRGSDIKNCSTTLSYAMVSSEQAWLCIDNAKVPEDLKLSLEDAGIIVLDYQKVFELASELPHYSTIYLDKSTTSTHLYNCINSKCRIISGINYTTSLKALKNDTEISNFRNCLTRDGVYVLKFMKWLEENVANRTVTELDAAEHLNSLREADSLFHDRSFTTIAGFGANAAQMHYLPTKESNTPITEGNFLLVDSGGHYKDGTTDITRTFSFGTLNEEQIHDYTLVIKSHINMARTVFLRGCRGTQIDYAARAEMWREGINYNCATGHGVGFFLNVHEGPQNIGQRFVDAELKPGMIITNEPGIYRSGKHGIRLENIMLCYEKETSEFGTFYAFETISPCPIETSALDLSMLNKEELDWLNSYHQSVYEQLSPHVDEDLKNYLREKTSKIEATNFEHNRA